MIGDLSFFAVSSTIPEQITSSTKTKDLLPCHSASLHPVETQSAKRAGHKP